MPKTQPSPQAGPPSRSRPTVSPKIDRREIRPQHAHAWACRASSCSATSSSAWRRSGKPGRSIRSISPAPSCRSGQGHGRRPRDRDERADSVVEGLDGAVGTDRARACWAAKAEPVVAARAPATAASATRNGSRTRFSTSSSRSYLLTANAMQEHGRQSARHSGRRAQARRILHQAFADAFAPTNFPLTNPEVLRATLQSNGENLVKGLDNLLADIERGHGELSIRQIGRRFRDRREYRHRPGQGGVPQRADRAAAISIRPRRKSMSGRC